MLSILAGPQTSPLSKAEGGLVVARQCLGPGFPEANLEMRVSGLWIHQESTPRVRKWGAGQGQEEGRQGQSQPDPAGSSSESVLPGGRKVSSPLLPGFGHWAERRGRTGEDIHFQQLSWLSCRSGSGSPGCPLKKAAGL